MMKFLFVVIFSVLISGCASIYNGSQQNISIRTEKDSDIFVDGQFAGKGFARVTLQRDEQHQIRVSKDKCDDMSLTTHPTFNKTSLLGLAVDLGLISIPTDFLTGAAWKIEPADIKLAPNCNS